MCVVAVSCRRRVSSQGVLFERRGRVAGPHLAGSGISIAAVAYAVLRTLHEHAVLAVVILGGWAALCALVVLNLPRLVYLIVDSETVRQRRYLLKRSWSRNAVGGLVRADLEYPGAKGHAVPVAVLTDHTGGGLGVVLLINWTEDEVAGLERAVGVPASDNGGTPITPDYLNTHLPGAMTGLAPYAAYIQQVAVLAFIVVIIGVITAAVISQN